ncbi:MAG TPA: thioredoxin family protein [Chthonomonadales bacterium]|nr:thioredoxin family protein [Chthonomonadales bacterium]
MPAAEYELQITKVTLTCKKFSTPIVVHHKSCSPPSGAVWYYKQAMHHLNTPSIARIRSAVTGWLPILFLLLSVGVLGAIREERSGGEICWSTGYRAAEASARRSGRPLLLSFAAPGNGWCEKMDAETFNDPAVIRLCSHYICARIENDINPELVSRYRVTAYPTTVLISPSGSILARRSGYTPPTQFAILFARTGHE